MKMDVLSKGSPTHTNQESCNNLEDGSFIKIVHYEGNATGDTDSLTWCPRADSDESHESNKQSVESTIEVSCLKETVPTDFVSRDSEANTSKDQVFSQCDAGSSTGIVSLKEHTAVYSGDSETRRNENWCSDKLSDAPIDELRNSEGPILLLAMVGDTELSNNNRHFTCGYCDKSFDEVRHLDEHMTSHAGLSENSVIDSDKKQYTCGLCEKSFTEVDDLKRHIRVHIKFYEEERDGYPCGLCNMSFTSVDDLKEHVSFHTGKTSFSCGICKKNFSQIDALRKHVNDHVITPGSSNIHTQRKLYSCGLCGESFYEVAELLTHRRVHFKLATRKLSRQEINFNMDNELLYCCRLCKVSFVTAVALKKHVKAHAVCEDLKAYAGRNLYCCGLCDYSFSNVSELGEHIAIHTNSLDQNILNFKTRRSGRRYFCNLCDNSFTNVFDLRGHLRDHKYLNSKARSAEKKGYSCVLCERTYTTVKNYKTHIRYHANCFILRDITDDEIYSLSLSKELFTKSYLKEEVKICACLSYDSENSMAEKQYCCGVCENSFAETDSLKEHMKHHGISANASNAKLYSCGLCWLFFSNFDDLKEHITLRSDVLRYGLLVKSDNYQNITKNVMKYNVYNRGMRYFCDICANSYTNILFLRNHIKNHNKNFNTETAEERPYSCVLCDKSFSAVPSYRRHIQKHAKYFVLKDHMVDEKCPLMFKQLFTKSHLKEEIKICSCLLYDSENYMAEKPYGCAICEKSFAEMQSLKEHTELHGIPGNGTNIKLYSCALCWSLFLNIDDLNQHVILRNDVLRYGLLTKDEKGTDFIIDAGKTQYSCGLCSESFSNVSELKTHIRVHSTYFKSKASTKLKQYSCGLCEKTFEEVGCLRAHIKMHTESVSNVQVKKEQHTSASDEKSFVQVEESVQHSELHEQFTGRCSNYKKEFSEICTLEKSRVLSSLGKGNYTCNYFDVLLNIKALNENIQLKRHSSCDTSVDYDEESVTNLSSKRIKRQPVAPEYCRRSFQSLKLLKYHLRVHTGEKPYSCDYCEKAFTYKKQFIIHLKTHTKNSND